MTGSGGDRLLDPESLEVTVERDDRRTVLDGERCDVGVCREVACRPGPFEQSPQNEGMSSGRRDGDRSWLGVA